MTKIYLIKVARYYVEHEPCTLRMLERIFRTSKSTIHRYFHTKLKTADKYLYNQVLEKLESNKNIALERAIAASKKKRK